MVGIGLSITKLYRKIISLIFSSVWTITTTTTLTIVDHTKPLPAAPVSTALDNNIIITG